MDYLLFSQGSGDPAEILLIQLSPGKPWTTIWSFLYFLCKVAASYCRGPRVGSRSCSGPPCPTRWGKRNYSHLPPLNSPTSAPSSSPAPQTPISRPAIDPGAAPCACGCTFIVHAGHRGAKHNHVRKPNTDTFHTTLNFLKTRLLPERSRLCQENARVCLCFGPSRFQNLVVIIFPPCCCVRHHHDLHPPRCQHHTACPAT